MTDIAQLGIQVSANGVDQANQSLSLLTVNSGKAEKASRDLVKGALDAEVALMKEGAAANQVAGSLNRASMHIGGMGKTAGVASHDLKNMVYQINDVGSTLAMGMSPMQVFLQQGTQISQIYTTSGATLKQWAASLGLLNPVVLTVTAAVAAMGASFSLASIGASDSLGTLRENMHLTGSQMDYLKKKGVDMSVTMGDMFKGYVNTVVDAANTALKPAFEGISKWWDKTIKDMGHANYEFWKMSAAGWAGMFGLIGSLAMNAGRGFSKFVDGIANYTKGLFEDIVLWYDKVLNKLSAKVNDLTRNPAFKLATGYLIPETNLRTDRDGISLGRSNKNATFDYWGTAMKAGRDSAEAAYSAFDKNIEKSREDRVLKGLEKYNAPKDKKAKDPKDNSDNVTVKAYTEEWNKFYGSAKQSVDAYTKSVELMKNTEGLSNLEKAKAQYYQGYINDIERQNLEPKSKLIALEKELAKAKGENKEAIKKEIEETKSQIIVLTESRDAKLKALAAETANADAQKSWLELNESTKKSLEDEAQALDIRAKTLWMGADAAEAFAFKQNLINQVDKDYLAAHPEIMKTIEERTAAFEKNKSMEKMIVQSEKWRDIMKDGFMSLTVRGNSFREVLSSIAQKLAEMAASDLWDKLWNKGKMSAANDNGGGGFWSTVLNWGSSLFKKNALGGVYSSPSLSAYSGQIVSQPTPFMFANGAGIMGEAGPEGILPLKRGRDGKLGVSSEGGTQTISVPIYIGNEHLDTRIIQISGGVATEVAGAGYKAVNAKQQRAIAYNMGRR